MSSYVLSRVAQGDLVEIRDYYLNQSSQRTARKIIVEFTDAFRLLASNPSLGHRREDLAESRPVLFWPVRDYLVVYRIKPRAIEVITLVHGFRDVAALLAKLERRS